VESSNPALGREFGRDGQRFATFDTQPAPSPGDLQTMYDRPAYAPPRPMTIDDVVAKTAVTLGVLAIAGAAAWVLDVGAGVAIAGALVGFVLALIIIFKQSTSPALVLSYAAAEGVFLGAISHVFNESYPGIAIQAVTATAAVFGAMLYVYKSRRIRVTPKFTRWLVGAMIGVFGLMVINLIAALIGGGDGLGLRSGGPLAIVFSLVCIGIAAFSFLLDFDLVEKAVQQGAPERFAWYAAFGLTVTLVWLYLEILRLISYLRD
jgi:uncharacterized YccA/Bax inhibitor family protein